MKVPASKPYFFNNDQKFILNGLKKILAGNSFLSMGNYGKSFENKFAKFIWTKYAVSCNSGTSALELICRSLNIKGKEIIVPSNTFIASVNAILNSGSKPIFADCANDMCIDYESIVKKITKKTAAIMVETIMGEGGIKVIPDWCLKGLRKICDKKNILLILDEVQCGIGRSGDFFAFEKSKVKPDIVPIAKGLGGGFPIGAVLMNKKVASGMIAGTHGSTFGGNPLAMTVGNSVMDIISNKKFLKSVKNISEYFLSNLNKIQNEYPHIIKEIRGRGLLIGIQLKSDQTKFIKKLMDNNLLTIRAAENVVRILPPLNVKKNEINQSLKIIKKVCSELK